MRHMTLTEVAYALSLVGWVKDKYGHLTKDLGGVKHRMVLGPQKVSLERFTRVTPTAENPSRAHWKPVDTFSYEQISITQASQIRMGSRLF